jgi:putative permease
MKQVVRYTTVILLTLGVLVALWEFREAIVLFLLSLVFGAVFRPVVRGLMALGLGRVVSILITYFLALGGLILLIYLVSGPAGRELQHATDNFALTYERLQRDWAEGTTFQQAVAGQLPPPDDLYTAITGTQGELLVAGIVGVAASLFGFLSAFAIVLALSMYWSIDRIYFERLWLSILPAGQRGRARLIWREIEDGVGAYIRSEIVQAVLTGLLLGLLYSLIGLRYPTLLAITGALAWLIPWLGAVLAIIPAFLVGLGGGLPLALLAALITLAVLVLMEVVVEKRLFERRRYSSVLLVLVAVAMADAMGLLGVIISPPLAAALQILGRRLLVRSTSTIPADPALQLNTLRTRLEQARVEAAGMDPAPAHVKNLISRLERLVREAEEALLPR